MMKLKYFSVLAVAALSLASCSEDLMDRINKDEGNPSSKVIPGKFGLTDAITSTVFSTIAGDYAFYTSSFTEQTFGTGNNQLKEAELRNINEIAGSSTFSNVWNSTYGSLYNLADIEKKCATGGIDANKYDLLGMAQTLEALNWGILTDMHGGIPCSNALGKMPQAPIDPQDSVYKRIFNLLDQAQANLAKGGDHVGNQDILFQGNLAQWTGLVHALRARYLLHTYGVNRSVLPTVLTEAQAALDAGFKGANFKVFNGKTADNSWSAYHWSRGYVATSSTVDKLLTDRNDPREPIYNYAGREGYNEVGVPGTEKQAIKTEQLNYPAWLDNGAAPLHLFSLSELYFIMAECEARLGQNAQAHFELGVKAAFADYISTGAEVAGVSIDDAAITAYLSSIASRFTANPLKEILVQKYIAQARDEQVETYNDIRRCRYADGSYPVAMTNPRNTQGGANRWPLRLPYAESDVVSNPHVKEAFGSGNAAGMYIFTSPVWWAGGK